MLYQKEDKKILDLSEISFFSFLLVFWWTGYVRYVGALRVIMDTPTSARRKKQVRVKKPVRYNRLNLDLLK